MVDLWSEHEKKATVDGEKNKQKVSIELGTRLCSVSEATAYHMSQHWADPL